MYHLNGNSVLDSDRRGVAKCWAMKTTMVVCVDGNRRIYIKAQLFSLEKMGEYIAMARAATPQAKRTAAPKTPKKGKSKANYVPKAERIAFNVAMY